MKDDSVSSLGSVDSFEDDSDILESPRTPPPKHLRSPMRRPNTCGNTNMARMERQRRYGGLVGNLTLRQRPQLETRGEASSSVRRLLDLERQSSHSRFGKTRKALPRQLEVERHSAHDTSTVASARWAASSTRDLPALTDDSTSAPRVPLRRSSVTKTTSSSSKALNQNRAARAAKSTTLPRRAKTFDSTAAHKVQQHASFLHVPKGLPPRKVSQGTQVTADMKSFCSQTSSFNDQLPPALTLLPKKPDVLKMPTRQTSTGDAPKVKLPVFAMLKMPQRQASTGQAA